MSEKKIRMLGREIEGWKRGMEKETKRRQLQLDQHNKISINFSAQTINYLSEDATLTSEYIPIGMSKRCV